MSPANHNDSDVLGRWSQYGRETAPRSRVFRAGLVSIALHILGFVVFMALPETQFHYTSQPTIRWDLRQAVTIVAPRVKEITQKDPNKDKSKPQLDIHSAL